jgi:hypothetical protein
VKSFLTLNQGLPTNTPLDVAFAPAFANFTSNLVTIDTTTPITSGTFETFDNSPAFTFTPSVSGTYKVEAAPFLYSASAGGYGNIRIFNTSGGATLIKESQAAIYGNTGDRGASIYCFSIYELVAGTTYVFDIQGSVNSSSIYLQGLQSPFAMEATGVGGVLTAPNFYTSSIVSTQSAGISGAFQTFSTSPALTFTPTYSGIYKVYSNASIYQVGASNEAVARIWNTSANATLLSESQGEIYAASDSGDIASVLIQSTYRLDGGVTYVFDIQGYNTGGTMYLRGGSASFYMYAELVSTVIGSGAPTQMVSGSSGGFTTASGSPTPVTNLQATITSTGLPVDLWLQYDGLGNGTATVGLQAASGSFASSQFQFLRNGTVIGIEQSELGTAPSGSYLLLPSSSIRFTDLNPPLGTNVYTMQVVNGGGASLIVSNAVLVAREVAKPSNNGAVNPITQRKPLAFSAYLSTGTSFGANTNVLFDSVEFNGQNVYNPSTGFFTAPYDCTFQFNFTGSMTASNVDVFIVTNNGASSKVIAQGISSAQCGGGRVMQLNKGDQVSIWMDTSNQMTGGSSFNGAVYAGAYATTQSKINLAGTNGIGSTNTTVMRFASVVESIGSDVTLAQDAALGDSFTIQTPGMYAVEFHTTDATLIAESLQQFNLTKNTTVLGGTGASDPNVLDVFNVVLAGGNFSTVKMTVTDYFDVGDVIRVLVSGATTYSDYSTNQGTTFKIVRVTNSNTSTNNVAVKYVIGSTQTVSGGNTINFDTKIYDDNNAVTVAGANPWRYTPGRPGIYRVTMASDASGTPQGTNTVWVNGAPDTYLFTNENGVKSGSATVRLTSNTDYISIVLDAGTNTYAGGAAPTYIGYVCIERVSD